MNTMTSKVKTNDDDGHIILIDPMMIDVRSPTMMTDYAQLLVFVL